MNKKNLFTVIMDTYYRPELLKDAVNAVFRQTHENIELILVNNGATSETVDYLLELAELDRRVKLVHFKENQYSVDDPLKMLDICLNAGLRVATGEYIWYQSDDDFMADDYVEKIVRLFVDNPECTTAAGIPVPIDSCGNIINTGPRRNNIRSRYMSGHIMALDSLRGGKMFGAPGTIFTIKRDVLVESGGFHRNLEQSHLYGIVPFGITGFDETAIFYWRRHDGQLNKQLALSGKIWINELHDWLDSWDINRKWQVFGTDTADEVTNTLVQRQANNTAHWFSFYLLEGQLSICYRMFRNMINSRNRLDILLALPQKFWPLLSRKFVWRMRVLLKSVILAVFRLLPSDLTLPSKLNKLRARLTE